MNPDHHPLFLIFHPIQFHVLLLTFHCFNYIVASLHHYTLSSFSPSEQHPPIHLDGKCQCNSEDRKIVAESDAILQLLSLPLISQVPLSWDWVYSKLLRIMAVLVQLNTPYNDKIKHYQPNIEVTLMALVSQVPHTQNSQMRYDLYIVLGHTLRRSAVHPELRSISQNCSFAAILCTKACLEEDDYVRCGVVLPFISKGDESSDCEPFLHNLFSWPFTVLEAEGYFEEIEQHSIIDTEGTDAMWLQTMNRKILGVRGMNG
ncbi:hypothetical protein BLNAU_1601 [Blattamonas nauphoetae]|uniref:Uncharacterized protein n=1 Tax=Blattamonas nauphoetae TaxID=2049346 RepID=A0ABQ9YIG7_9EUKA|nr:hypothetical protein BLNAU_1601 [Blattamonas nauphoetae]